MTTDESEEQFWGALRRAVRDATGRPTHDVDASVDDAAELAAAERLLAELEQSPPAPLSDAQIETIVDHALAAIAADARPASADVAPVGRAPRRIGRLLAVAAALCTTPAFLAAAAVVTVAAVASVVLRNTTQTLRFQDAVRLLVSDGSPDTTKNPALGTVHADLVWTLQAVQRVALGDPGSSDAALLTSAQAVLQRVRAALGSDDPFVLRPMPDDMIALVDQVEDRGLGAAARQRALQRLGDLMVYGVGALKDVERTPQSGRITRQTAAVLRQLAGFLD